MLQYCNTNASKKVIKINEILGETNNGLMPDAFDEPWVVDVNSHLSAAPVAEQTAWKRLFAHTQFGDRSKPTKRWIATASEYANTIGTPFVLCLARWLSLVVLPEPVPVSEGKRVYGNSFVIYRDTLRPISDRNIGILKGLAWSCAGRTEPEVARALEKMTVACLAKFPGTGPWAVRAASAAVYALSESPDNPESVPALARLKTKVTYKTTLTQIERALETAAKRRGVTKDDLEDLSVPTYGLTIALVSA